MAPREDLVNSAVSFLQDPSVASSPLDKQIAFLQSKNLTQEEIDLSLARARDGTSAAAQPQAVPYYPPPPQQSIYRQPPGNYNYNQYGNWQPPPLEPPKRDWRDWFIMATVVGGASYGLWVLTQRYIKPLIAPPTPPQLEQDKAAIDEQAGKDQNSNYHEQNDKPTTHNVPFSFGPPQRTRFTIFIARPPPRT